MCTNIIDGLKRKDKGKNIIEQKWIDWGKLVAEKIKRDKKKGII